MPGTRLEVLEGAGHFVPWWNADKIFAVLEDFREVDNTHSRARTAGESS